MSDERQPEAVWVFPEKKSNKGRIWLIVLLAVAAVAIVGVMLFFVIPRDGALEPTPSPTDSATATPSPTPTTTPTPTPTPTEAPEPEPTPPPVPDPDISTFTGQVQPRLDDAVTGLGFVSDMSGQEAVQVVDSLQLDAANLSDAAAPSSIAAEWHSAVDEYASTLTRLRTTFENGTAPQSAIDAASSALQSVRSVVGL